MPSAAVSAADSQLIRPTPGTGPLPVFAVLSIARVSTIPSMNRLAIESGGRPSSDSL